MTIDEQLGAEDEPPWRMTDWDPDLDERGFIRVETER
jgi:hypothetical protein